MTVGEGIYYSTLAIIAALFLRAWFRAMSRWW